MIIRAATPADHPAVVALNHEVVPAMNEIDRTFLERLAPHASVFLVAESGSGEGERSAAHGIVGFLLAFPAGAPYDSDNYRWFSERYSDFQYVDRVAVTAAARGAGVGRALYAALEDRLGAAQPAGRPPICCEVNLRPANPGSLAFHRRLGFRVVGEQDTDGGRKRVALMVRDA